MIGSRGKVGAVQEAARGDGLLDGELARRWARLRAPIGLDIGAETPEEIAIAIAAELVARAPARPRRRCGSSSAGSLRDGGGDPRGGRGDAARRRREGAARSATARRFWRAIVATAREVGLDAAVVVVGPPFGEAVAAHARELGAQVAWNPEPARGMASSIALGFAALDARATPRGCGRSIIRTSPRRRCARWSRRSATTTSRGRCYGGRGGHPPLVARALWPALTRRRDRARDVIARATSSTWRSTIPASCATSTRSPTGRRREARASRSPSGSRRAGARSRRASSRSRRRARASPRSCAASGCAPSSPTTSSRRTSATSHRDRRPT